MRYASDLTCGLLKVAIGHTTECLLVTLLMGGVRLYWICGTFVTSQQLQRSCISVAQRAV
jgi:hypothetical protein